MNDDIAIPPRTLDLDKILTDIGNFGRYQMMVLSYLMLNVVSNAVKNNQYVFNAGPIEYRCKVPQCESSPPTFEPGPWAKFALPKQRDCFRYVSVGSSCEPDSFTDQTEPCHSWVYENKDTIVYEFELACQKWKRTMVGTLRSVAYFCTIPFISFFSDEFGRRSVLIFTSVSPVFVGVARSYSDSYPVYIALEFLEAFLGTGAYSTVFILALEMMNLKNRVIGGCLLSCTYSIGLALLGIVAWLVPYWRNLTRVLYAPGIVFLVYICIAQESVRWLISKGRLKEAAIAILKATRTNSKRLSIDTETTLKYFAYSDDEATVRRKSSLKLPSSPISLKKVPLYKQVLRSRVISCRIVIVSFWWVTVTMVYYGLTINSVSLAGNKYVNFIMTSLVEIPGYLLSLVTLDRFGRKGSIMTAFMVAGLSLLLIGIIKNQTTVIMLSMVGKLCVSMTFCSIYIYTVELFPTQARHQLMGACSMVGRFGSMIAPQTPLLALYMKSLPYLLFGSMSTVAGMLMLLTPETLKLKLPDTFEEAENMNIIPRTNRRADILKEISTNEI